MTFYQRFWHWNTSFASLPMGLERWLPLLPKGWSLQFGLFLKYTIDNPGPPLAASSSRRFRYEPMNFETQIRLLRIHPGSPEDVLETTMITADLANLPAYEALSYVWGDASDEVALRINGRTDIVRRSLSDALHELRHQSSERLVWADAICINQDNFDERNHQVKIMDQIYASARDVVVHLGTPTPWTEDGMRALAFFVMKAQSHSISNVGQDMNPPWLHTPSKSLRKGLTDILGRSWFTRLWTVQEITLARHTTLICGHHSVSWSTNLQTVRLLIFHIKSAIISPQFVENEDLKSIDWTPLISVLETQLRQAGRREFTQIRRNHLDLLYDFKDRVCLHPQDRYYGMFAIMEHERDGHLVAVDYRLSLEELHDRYTRAIRQVINEELGLDLVLDEGAAYPAKVLPPSTPLNEPEHAVTNTSDPSDTSSEASQRFDGPT